MSDKVFIDAPNKLDAIAKMAHEASRAYCRMHGDDSQMPWEAAPENIKESARIGVRHIMANPNTTPRESHESWLRTKEADGWVYGPVKDMVKKTHPCYVPYDDLDPINRVKDEVFGSVVRAALASIA